MASFGYIQSCKSPGHGTGSLVTWARGHSRPYGFSGICGRERHSVECMANSNMKITMKNPRILEQNDPASSGKLDTFQKHTALGMLLRLGKPGVPDHRTSVTMLSQLPTMGWILSSLKTGCNSGGWDSSHSPFS